MSLFAKFDQDVADEKDVLGGGGGFATDTAVYNGRIKLAYADYYASGAMFVSLEIELPETEFTHKERITVTNKQGENTYVKNGVKRGLPGFTLINDICLLTLGKPLNEVITVEKDVLVWDNDLKKEVPQAKEVLTELTDQPILVAIAKIRTNKQEKDATGEYVNTPEERIFNEIKTVFDVDSFKTVAELKDGVETATFIELWREKYEGQVIDNYKEVVNQGVATIGAGKALGGKLPSKAASAPVKTVKSNPFNKK